MEWGSGKSYSGSLQYWINSTRFHKVIAAGVWPKPKSTVTLNTIWSSLMKSGH